MSFCHKKEFTYFFSLTNQYHLKFINKYSLGGFKIVLQEKQEFTIRFDENDFSKEVFF
jgi:hypothetical protein